MARKKSTPSSQKRHRSKGFEDQEVDGESDDPMVNEEDEFESDDHGVNEELEVDLVQQELESNDDVVEVEDVSSSDGEWQNFEDESVRWREKRRSRKTGKVHNIKEELPEGWPQFRELFLNNRPPLGKYPMTIHSHGKWPNRKDLPDGRTAWKVSDYQGGIVVEEPDIDGDTLSILGLEVLIYDQCGGVEFAHLVDFIGHPMLVINGLQLEVETDFELMSYAKDAMDEMQHLHIFMEYEFHPLAEEPPLEHQESVDPPLEQKETVEQEKGGEKVVSSEEPDEQDMSRKRKIKGKAKVVEEEPEAVDISDLPEERLDPIFEDLIAAQEAAVGEVSEEAAEPSEEHAQAEEDDPFNNIEPEEGYQTFDEADEWEPPPEFEELERQSREVYTREDSEEQIGYEAVIVDPEVGMQFPTVQKCREFLKDYAIFNKFEYHLDKNDPDRIRASCSNRDEHDCPWLFYARVSASKKADRLTCTVQGYNHEHSDDCKGNPMFANSLADSNWVAKKLLDQFKVHHRVWKAKAIQDEVWYRYGVNITYFVAWYGRCKMLEKVFGNYERSYKLTPSCCLEVLRCNPRSIATVSRESADESFMGMCISFKVCTLGWIEGCRPILGLDGCHLKGKYGGVCLSITGLDGNNGLYPIAIYICRGEDCNTWRKFLEIMSADLTDHPHKLTFMSDQQKGLKDVIQDIFPGSNHRYCFRHMYANFKKNNKGGKALESIIWGAARAYKPTDCEKWMKQLEGVHKDSHDWLVARGVNTWQRSTFDTSSYCEHITNNFSESFNAWISDLRDRTPTGFVEYFCMMMMTQMRIRQQAARKMDINGLLPRVNARLKHLETFLNKYTYRTASDHCFLVELYGGTSRWLVDLQKRTCECRVFQLTGIPCVHAVVIIKLRKLEYYRYCHDYCTVKAYLRTYGRAIYPLPTDEDWPEPPYVVKAPPLVRGAGRPKKKRRRGADEEPESHKGIALSKTPYHCTICDSTEHTRRTCKGKSKREVAEADAKKRAEVRERQEQRRKAKEGKEKDILQRKTERNEKRKQQRKKKRMEEAQAKNQTKSSSGGPPPPPPPPPAAAAAAATATSAT